MKRNEEWSAGRLSAYALAVGMMSAAPATFAQEPPAPATDADGKAVKLDKVFVTGSAIKRIDAETVVPVTVLKVEDLKKQGLTTVEQILGTLAVNQSSTGTSQTVGAGTGGASFADIRGIGSNKTLVLLNGRRIANNAIDGSAPDLNMIPVAALERIEVLRDGASALYGTDAIGGVINFITRKDYQGGSITLGADSPTQPGGDARNANIGFGFGDLQEKGFNVFGFVDYQEQKKIGGTDRDFNRRYPGGLSPTTSPANYFQDGEVVGNPIGPSCVGGDFLIPTGDGTSCTMTTSSFVNYVPKSDRVSGFLKGEYALNSNHTVSAEYFASRAKVYTQIAPVPYGTTFQNPTRPDGSPNPYYPGNSGNSFTPAFTPDPTFDGGRAGTTASRGGALIQPGYVIAKWRDIPNGPRGDKNVNEQQRIALSLDGNLAGWDYGAGLTYNQNKVDVFLISGYNDGQKILEGILTGVINPYGAQDAAGTALINSALLKGQLNGAKGTTKGADAHASREIGDWLGAGKQVAVAFGAEYRKEDFTDRAADPDYAARVVASTGYDPESFNSGDRNVAAAYSQLDVPVLSNLDLTFALRYDDYSDFGSTTNPKVGFRFQPDPTVVLRGAYSTGFRAPSLYDLNAAQAYTNTSQVDDPVTCPGGVPTGPSINNCQAQFQTLTGGNQDLDPEKSKTYTFGVVFEPSRQLTVSADFWSIKITDQIGSIANDTLFDPANQATFGSLFFRNSSGRLSTDGTDCPGVNCGYVDSRLQNLGDLETNGVDFSAVYRKRAASGNYTFSYYSTWIDRYDYQDYTNGPFNHNVGAFVGTGAIFRWQHSASLAWKKAAYSAGLVVHRKSSYFESALDSSDPLHKVGAYMTADVYTGWAPLKGLDLLLGVKNIANTEPPLSYQNEVFQAGYDPRYTDPAGRVIYGRVGYSF